MSGLPHTKNVLSTCASQVELHGPVSENTSSGNVDSIVQLGLAKRRLHVPDDIDECNEDVRRLFEDEQV